MSRLTVTVEELTKAGAWDRFIELRGLNPWCKKDGQVRNGEEFTLTLAEAQKLGLVGGEPGEVDDEPTPEQKARREFIEWWGDEPRGFTEELVGREWAERGWMAARGWVV